MLEAYGTGNLPDRHSELLAVLADAAARGVVVVVVEDEDDDRAGGLIGAEQSGEFQGRCQARDADGEGPLCL